MLLIASYFVAAMTGAEPMVTLRLPATATSKILDQVEASTGTKLSLQASFKEMPLIVSVSNVPLSTFLANVGRALALEVEPIDGGYKLIRTPKMQSEIAEVEAKTYADIWSKTLTKWSGVLSSAPWTTQLANTLLKKENDSRVGEGGLQVGGGESDYQKTGPRLNVMQPSARLLYKALASLGPNTLGHVGVAQTIIYSRFPNRLQRPMPASMENWIRAYETESALNPPPVATASRNEDVFSSVAIGTMPGRFQRSILTLEGGVGKVHLSVSRDRAIISIYNKDGSELDQAYSPGYGDLSAEPSEKPTKPFKNLQTIVPGPLTKAQIAYSDTQFDRYDDDGDEISADAVAVSPQLQEFLLNPEKYDPLSLLASDVLLSYADQTQQNLIASVGEYFSDPAGILPDEGGRDVIDVADAMNSIIDDDPNVSPDAGWTVYRPADLLSHENGFIARSASGKYARDTMKSGYNLDSDIAFCRFVNADYYADWYYGDSLVDYYLQDQLGDHDMPGLLCLRFLGTLGIPQRQNLAKGGSLTVGSLTTAQAAALSNWIYDPSATMTGDMSWGGDDNERQPIYLREATERFPNGIPNQTTITMTTHQSSGYFVSGQVMSPKMIAAAILLPSVMPPDDEEREYVPDPSRTLAASVLQTRYDLMFTFAPQKQFTETFSYQNRTGNRHRLTLQQLANNADVKNWLQQLKGLSRNDLMSAYEGMDEMDEDVDED